MTGGGRGAVDEDLAGGDIEEFLRRHEHKELVRFVAVGSVDDGKSTLIGRLLHDSHGLFDDQLAAVKKASRGVGTGEGGELDFALFTDGLRAEREQGITIDVAYRYFATARRKFILADTPGHVQYTRNMATGASTADVAVILLDARLGVLPQSRRHAYLASLLGIRRLLVAVNKMDLCDYSQAVFERLRGEFGEVVAGMDFAGVEFVPVSARLGDNVVQPSARMPWFSGGTVLSYLEEVPVERGREDQPLRLPIQCVLRPSSAYRAFAGQIASGVLRAGQEVLVLPSLTRARVAAIDVYEGALESARAPQSVAVRLDREVDVSRGEMLVEPGSTPRIERRFAAMLVWLSEAPFDPARSLLLKHTTRVVPARIERLEWRMDLERLQPGPAAGLSLNDIARVTVRAHRPLFLDDYRQCRATGAFILVDALENSTVAAGMVLPRLPGEREGGEDGSAPDGGGAPALAVTAGEREARLGQRGAVVWLAEEGAGAAALDALERRLFEEGVAAVAVPGAGLSAEAFVEVVVRCADAGLAVLAVGGGPQARAAVVARLGGERCVAATVEEAAQIVAARCLPD